MVEKDSFGMFFMYLTNWVLLYSMFFELFCLVDNAKLNYFEIKKYRLDHIISFLFNINFSGGFTVVFIYWIYGHWNWDTS